MVIKQLQGGILLGLHYEDALNHPPLQRNLAACSILPFLLPCANYWIHPTSHFYFSSLGFGPSALFGGHNMPPSYLPPTLSCVKKKGGVIIPLIPVGPPVLLAVSSDPEARQSGGTDA